MRRLEAGTVVPMADAPGAPIDGAEDHVEVFQPTADGILDWVLTTQPRPSREEVLTYVQGLRAEGLLPDAETAKLAGTYPELLGHEFPG